MEEVVSSNLTRSTKHLIYSPTHNLKLAPGVQLVSNSMGGVGSTSLACRRNRTAVSSGAVGHHGSMGSVFLSDLLSEKNQLRLYRKPPTTPTRKPIGTSAPKTPAR